MKRFIYKDQDGDWSEAIINKEDSALQKIRKRIEYSMPIETVDAEKLKIAVASFNIDFKRPLKPDEAKILVNALKAYVIKEIEKAEKFYVSKRGKNENS